MAFWVEAKREVSECDKTIIQVSYLMLVLLNSTYSGSN